MGNMLNVGGVGENRNSLSAMIELDRTCNELIGQMAAAANMPEIVVILEMSPRLSFILA